MTLLKLEKITKYFRSGVFGRAAMPAVSDIDLTVEPGRIVSLVGESGSGKTTVGRMILRLISPTTGKIVFDGNNVSVLKGKALHAYYRHVQGVFQDPFSAYNPIFKIDRIFDSIRRAYLPELPPDAWRAKIEDTLETVGLRSAAVLGKYPHQLSGGQLQRLLIARALLLDLRLLVADEVISMLDASLRIDILNLLGDLKTRGLGIVFITHNLSLCNYVSDTTLVLRNGRIVETGATEKVFGDPRHPYTKLLLDSVPRIAERWSEEQLIERIELPANLDAAARSGPLQAIAPDHLIAPF